VDEAGRGPLAGPVVVSAVILDLKSPLDGVNDSKKVPDADRRRLSEELKKTCQYSTVSIPVAEIETLNILGATMRGMRRSLALFWDLIESGRALIAVDGNIKIPEVPEDRQVAIVKGDAKSATIAAASILAKVERDKIMEREALRFPGYGFEEHKGYGSPRHIEAIRSLGLCEIHRPSFCRKFLSGTSTLPPDAFFLRES
jgi:ribonuclease HII